MLPIPFVDVNNSFMDLIDDGFDPMFDVGALIAVVFTERTLLVGGFANPLSKVSLLNCFVGAAVAILLFL